MKFWNPARHILAVFIVRYAKCIFKNRFFNKHDQDMIGEKEKQKITYHDSRSIPDDVPQLDAQCAQINRVTNIAIQSSDDQFFWRIKMRGGAASLADDIY